MHRSTHSVNTNQAYSNPALFMTLRRQIAPSPRATGARSREGLSETCSLLVVNANLAVA